MVRRQTWQARRFEIFESARHFRIESNRDVRFESNLEASQVPNQFTHSFIAPSIIRCSKSPQKSAVPVCQVTTLVMETMQLVLSQFKKTFYHS